MIKAIIFDFAGVIGADGYWVWLKKTVPELDSKREYFQKISEGVDRGKMADSEFLKAVSKGTGIPQDKIWQQVYKEIVINKELLQYIKQLKSKYKIGLLSNFHSPWLREIFTNHKLDLYFDKVIISSEHGIIKPEPAIFHKMLEMLNVTKEEAVFIDDRQVNVDAASNIGIKGILFSSNDQLKNSFLKLGIDFSNN